MKTVHVIDNNSNNNNSNNNKMKQVDVQRSRYPFCIVWTPLPIITWFLPFIGHMGIARSDGVIRDFGGPYYVAEDNFSFGKPTKYWKLDPNKVYISPDEQYHDKAEKFDAAVEAASTEYCGLMHNICIQNCHHHTAAALNLMRYDGRDDWGQVRLALYMLLYSSFPNFTAFLKTYLPAIIIYGLIILAAVLK